MKEIIWEDYLYRDDLKICTEAELKSEEVKVGVILPETLKSLIMLHGGESPENLTPIYPKGKNMTIECIYHAYPKDDKYGSYTISFATSCLAEGGYNNYVAFSNKGSVFLALDYNVRKLDPPVVFVFKDSPSDDPEHRYFLADSFDEFLECFTL